METLTLAALVVGACLLAVAIIAPIIYWCLYRTSSKQTRTPVEVIPQPGSISILPPYIDVYFTQDGRPYYFNRVTKCSSWTYP